MTKIRSITKLYKTLLCSVYLGLFIIRIFKTFRPAGCTTGCKVYTDLKQAYVFSGTGGRTTPVVERLFMAAHHRISAQLRFVLSRDHMYCIHTVAALRPHLALSATQLCTQLDVIEHSSVRGSKIPPNVECVVYHLLLCDAHCLDSGQNFVANKIHV